MCDGRAPPPPRQQAASIIQPGRIADGNAGAPTHAPARNQSRSTTRRKPPGSPRRDWLPASGRSLIGRQRRGSRIPAMRSHRASIVSLLLFGALGSGCGAAEGDTKGNGGDPTKTVRGHGLRIDLPAGWHGEVVRPQPSGGLTLRAASFPLPPARGSRPQSLSLINRRRQSARVSFVGSSASLSPRISRSRPHRSSIASRNPSAPSASSASRHTASFSSSTTSPRSAASRASRASPLRSLARPHASSRARPTRLSSST